MKKNIACIAGVTVAISSTLFYSFKFVHQKNPDTIVQTESGLVSGVISGSGNVIAYKGIPFAAAPVGPLRWKAPQPAVSWTGVRKCESFGPSPMQPKPVPFMVYTTEFLIPEKPISEDCLYLNVWTKFKAGDKRPVFVWIYGGGFGSGGTSVPIYDGEALTKKGIVFVSANYRVGAFGFLAHPELSKESSDKSSGNYGLMDQIAGLQWIKKNIAAFGGDPDNISIAGQSAGSMIVNCLVVSPKAKGLFNKAISESGSLFVLKLKDLPAAEQEGLEFARSVHAGSLQELRNIPADELLKSAVRFWPIVDGNILPASVTDIFMKGEQNNVPVITGWNADESFVSGFKNKDQFRQMATDQYGPKADEFLQYFPAGTDEEARLSQIKLSRDSGFALSGFKWAGIQSAQKKAPVYVYFFSRKLPATAEFVKYGAFHTGEVAYVTDNLKFLKRPWETVDHQLASMMSDYWVNFISHSDPNSSGLPDWPAYNPGQSEVMVFDKKSGKQTLPDKNELEFMLKQWGH
jgi:para-nitrobenzyl esterase